jgi:hypothetical protein
MCLQTGYKTCNVTDRINHAIAYYQFVCSNRNVSVYVILHVIPSIYISADALDLWLRQNRMQISVKISNELTLALCIEISADLLAENATF